MAKKYYRFYLLFIIIDYKETARLCAPHKKNLPKEILMKVPG